MSWDDPVRTWSFTVPGPPVPCARVRVVKTLDGPRGITQDKTRAYKKHVGFLALAARPRDWSLAGTYGLVVDVYRSHKSGDADNFLKTFSDALNTIAWTDDARVYRMAVRLFDAPRIPHAVVTVEQLA